MGNILLVRFILEPHPRAVAKTYRMIDGCPDRCSVMLKIAESSSLPSAPRRDARSITHVHATRLTAVRNSQEYSCFPVATSHRRIVLSAPPVTAYFVCATVRFVSSRTSSARVDVHVLHPSGFALFSLRPSRRNDLALFFRLIIPSHPCYSLCRKCASHDTALDTTPQPLSTSQRNTHNHSPPSTHFPCARSMSPASLHSKCTRH